MSVLVLAVQYLLCNDIAWHIERGCNRFSSTLIRGWTQQRRPPTRSNNDLKRVLGNWILTAQDQIKWKYMRESLVQLWPA